ncbi:MAG: hypothetical protein NTZ09_19265, partial [Candidatus Hydrogenedentes bacterium]|nr:hypothetical protein [Candidatus Hydrogenedentota bacterium]
SEWPDKETYRDFVKESIDMGYLDDLKISNENAKITFEAKNKAVVYPIDATASFGSASLKAVLTDENGKWLVTDVTMEQY